MIYDLPLKESARPANWIAQPLHKLANAIGGGTPETEVAEYWHPPEIPWATPTDISACVERVLTRTERAISGLGLRESSATLLPIGTTLLTSRATVGECRLAGVRVATNQGFASLVPKEAIDPEFLFYLAQTLKPVLVRLAAGTTFIEVSRREVRRVNVCVPAEPKEREIIGQLLSLADGALAAKDAQLTAARRLKTAMMQQLFTRGVPGRHTRFKKTKIGDIPEAWDVGRISKVVATDIYNGISPQSRPEPPGTPILNVSCISDGLCDPSKVTYVDLDGPPSEDLLAKKGDFYILRGNGNREFIGTGGLLVEKPPEHCVFSDLLIKISFDHTKTVEGFMPMLWQSHSFLRSLQSKAVSGSGLWKIGLREIRRHEFAQPPVDEQSEIVEILSGCDETVQGYESEVRATDRLKRSLLQNLLTGRVRVRV